MPCKSIKSLRVGDLLDSGKVQLSLESYYNNKMKKVLERSKKQTWISVNKGMI